MNRKIAVITGATSGIGKEFAIRLAEKGYDLLLTGRREKLLNEVKSYIEREYKVNVILFIVDFNNNEEFNKLLNYIEGINNIEFLVNNSGHGAKDTFTKDNVKNQLDMVGVHILAVIKLCHLIGNKMKKNKKGYIINVSSIASFNSFPTSGMYCATKGFLTSFSQSLALELEDFNINVQALCPGFTRTDFHSKLNMDGNKLKNKGIVKWMTPSEVVGYSLEKINKPLKVIVIPGIGNKVMVLASRICPRGIYYKIAKRGWKLLD
ncbi:SDR family NAD(P)-dependent oxidoreductase [Clostridium sp.]|uniref:SDR family NAD(P)-dependent oxidoreductase n=1 Tax=Clostridium sp. TaxID=1506 RepID=UPI002FCB4489